MAGSFQVYEDRAGKWRFRLKASNGQVVAVGEAYETKASAKKGCESVMRAAQDAPITEEWAPDVRRWRVGDHYGIHVYAVADTGDADDDEPIASFLGDPDRARQHAEQVVMEHNVAVQAGRPRWSL